MVRWFLISRLLPNNQFPVKTQLPPYLGGFPGIGGRNWGRLGIAGDGRRFGVVVSGESGISPGTIIGSSSPVG